MKYRVVHRTEYTYEEPVTLCYNEAHVRPRDTEHQRLLSHTTEITPPAQVRTERNDFFGNSILHFAIQSGHDKLSIHAVSQVEIDSDLPEAAPESTIAWEDAVALTRKELSAAGLDARQYTLQSPMIHPTPEVAAYARESFGPGRPVLEAVTELMHRLHAEFTFDPESTTVSTPVAEVLQQRRGVCQDFAHLGIAFLRSLGLPARYVSGYIETAPPSGGQKLVGADASHAWISVYIPDAGWVDFDPTNDQITGDTHIVTAWGRDYSDVTPIKGVIFGGGATHTTRVAVDVERT